MKAVFVYKDAESLGIESLSAALKHGGHETSLVFESFLFDSPRVGVVTEKKVAERPYVIAQRIVKEKPDLVAFSVVTDYYQWVCSVAETLKSVSDVPVVFGGIHVTALPEQSIANPFVDYIVVGEGEDAIVELAGAIEEGGDAADIANVWSKSGDVVIRNEPRPAIENLDTIPFPDKSIFTDKVPVYKEIYYAMSSRGCPYSCTYCCNSLLNKMYGARRFLRKRSVENMIEELKRAKKKQPFRMVFFVDDDFLSDKKWLREFLELYKRDIGMIFRCGGCARNVDDEVATMLADAGCKRIQIGVQTWNEQLKRDVCGRYDTNEQIFKACEAVKKAGIYLDLDHILGLPLHVDADHIDAVRQYARVRPNNINCFWLRYYPGTQIVEFARSHGLLSDEDVEAIEDGVQENFFRGGSVKDTSFLVKIQALFTLVPFVSEKMILKLLDRQWYKLAPKSFLIFFAVPRLIQMPFHRDIWYYAKRSLFRFPPFRK
ncbi:MAG: cobalamin B12-binding domain-containing protein [Candidatus Abyssubacteria bacterium]|nr:cobalamin B12-binding domain-containing protein [Candidatus Abyssubacteria bacterium]